MRLQVVLLSLLLGLRLVRPAVAEPTIVPAPAGSEEPGRWSVTGSARVGPFEDFPKFGLAAATTFQLTRRLGSVPALRTTFRKATATCIATR